jgi:hypothetical protein
MAWAVLHRSKVCLAILVSCALGLSAAVARADVYAAPNGRWAITIPSGWQKATPAELRVVQDEAAKAASGLPGASQMNFELLIRPKVPDGQFVVVQISPALPPGLPFDSLASGVAMGVKAGQKAAAERFGTVDSQAPVIDHARHRVSVSFSMAQPGGPTLRALSTSQWGLHESASIHAYAPEESFDARRPLLQSITDSFQFTSGNSYDFSVGNVAKATSWGRAIGGIAVIGVVALYVIIRRVTR